MRPTNELHVNNVAMDPGKSSSIIWLINLNDGTIWIGRSHLLVVLRIDFIIIMFQLKMKKTRNAFAILRLDVIFIVKSAYDLHHWSL